MHRPTAEVCAFSGAGETTSLTIPAEKDGQGCAPRAAISPQWRGRRRGAGRRDGPGQRQPRGRGRQPTSSTVVAARRRTQRDHRVHLACALSTGTSLRPTSVLSPSSAAQRAHAFRARVLADLQVHLHGAVGDDPELDHLAADRLPRDVARRRTSRSPPAPAAPSTPPTIFSVRSARASPRPPSVRSAPRARRGPGPAPAGGRARQS